MFMLNHTRMRPFASEDLQSPAMKLNNEMTQGIPVQQNIKNANYGLGNE